MSQAKAKSKKGDGPSNVFYIVIAIVVAAVLLFSIGYVIFNTVRTSINWNAATVGNEKISPQELSFHYYLEYNKLYDMYGEYIGYFLDTSKPLSTQEYSEGQTWHEYLVESALTSIQNTVMLESKAKAEGMSLSEEDIQNIDDIIATTTEQAEGVNMSVDLYLQNIFADTRMTAEIYRNCLLRSTLADNYRVKIQDGMKELYTDEQIKQQYSENSMDYDLVTYRRFFFSANVETEEGVEATEEQQAAALEEARIKAEEMVSKMTDEASFVELSLEYAEEDMKEYYEDDGYTLYSDARATAIGEELRNWLYEDGRKAGDFAAIESSTGYYVGMFLNRYLDDYRVVSVRHLLVNPEVDEGAEEATEEQWAAAKAEAERLYAEWQAGPATEDSFAAMATEYTDDTASAEDGGLYTDITKGMMVAPFSDWSFDKSRKPGDTDVVETEFGFHLMYFVEYGEEYWKTQIVDKMLADEYTAWQAAENESFPVKSHELGISKVGMNFS